MAFPIPKSIVKDIPTMFGTIRVTTDMHDVRKAVKKLKKATKRYRKAEKDLIKAAKA